VATPFFSLYYKDSESPDEPTGRVAYIAGKKNGNAVWRNRAKRKLRAAWGLNDVSAVPYDVLLVANKRTVNQSALMLSQVLNDVLSQEGLLQ